MRSSRRWIVAPVNDAAGELAERLKTSPLIAQVLLNRGISEIDDCRAFLSPSLKLLHEPEAIPGVAQAAQRIAQAIRDKQKIVVYGDYDVDGITATSILWHAIRRLGGVCDYYIPHRIDEGYGLNAAAIAQICDQGAQLIITVDCGVTAIEPAGVARDRGVDLIVTDHHEFKENDEQKKADAASSGHRSLLLPPCHTLVHPRLPSDTPYPNPHLCGAGVAFKLAWAVGKAVTGSAKVSEDFRNFLIDAMALAALGTIADVVPLVGENRILAHFGLGGLKASKLTGIRALIGSANLDGQKLDSYHVGFLLAPRLNAAGRMGHAALAVEMLTTATIDRASEIANYLEQQNRARQATERTILDQALAQATELKLDTPEHHAIVLGDTKWHAGVIGIVASRIVERFHKPVIMVAMNEDGICQGSGRSVSGFHLAAALSACGEHLIAHGGHEMAAGLKVTCDNFEKFRQCFLDHAKQVVSADLLVPRLNVDAEAELRMMSESLVNDLHRLGPFGQGNRKPVLACRDLELVSPPRRVGKTGDHLQLFVRQSGVSMKAIAFNAGEFFDKLTPGCRLSLAVEPQINEWNGRRSVELEVKDLQIGTS
jgi:single-stranded-DNA-specific exonuclease